jgi:CheY-like chemotaxis protein
MFTRMNETQQHLFGKVAFNYGHDKLIRRADNNLFLQRKDLIDLARIEAGQLELIAKEFNLMDTLKAVAHMLRLMNAEQKLSINFSLSNHAVGEQQNVPCGIDRDGGIQDTPGLDGPDRFSRVLLVDDSLENRALMRLLLARQPLTIDEANNGREALELFEQNEYALVLMDIQMPIIDGYTATRMIRRIEERNGRRRTPVVALTAHAYEEDIRRCSEAGCDDHIAKPFKKMGLLQCLAHYLPGIEYG